jgi:hypothetical protein
MKMVGLMTMIIVIVMSGGNDGNGRILETSLSYATN